MPKALKDISELSPASLWHRNHPEVNKAKCKEYYKKNKHVWKRWAANNIEKKRALRKQYRIRNREKIRVAARDYYKRKPEIVLANVAKRRAKMSCPREEFLLIREIYRTAKSEETIPCMYCGILTTNLNRDVDHIIPLSRGGAHCVANLCFSCSTCNNSKYNKLLEEWK